MKQKQNLNKCSYIFIVFAILFLALNAWYKVYANPIDEVNSYIDEFQKRSRVKYVNVVVYNNGKVNYYGNNDTGSLYQIGSMTKSFTGLGILKLVKEGRISLNDDVSDLLDNFVVFYNGSRVKISVEDLLRHTSGFTNSEREYPGANFEMSLMGWVSSVSGSELQFEPGSSFSYANANYNLLGAIIESVSGKSYKEYMEEELLNPLKLNNIIVGTPSDKVMICNGSRLGYGMVFPYIIDIKEGRIPAGYLYANIEDMCRYLMIQLGDIEIPEEYKNLIDLSHKYLLYNDKQSTYFAGWESFDNDIIGHSGGTANYSSKMIFSKEKDIAVCVLANMNAAASVDRLCDDIFAISSGQEKQGFVSDIWRIFDIIYSWISFGGIALIIVAFNLIKKYKVLISLNIAVIILFISQIVIMPLIFQSGWKDIALVWAPWSLLGGLLIQIIDIIALSVMALMRRKRRRILR